MSESKKGGGLGFRDLESFNKAILAKQIWRMQNNPDSLVTKIMKEKYFKNGNLLEAQLGSTPSLIWRSIWSSLDLVKVRMVWRARNGRSIKIWQDKWIPMPTSLLKYSPQYIC